MCSVRVEQPSREELLALIAAQARVIEELTARVAAQDARIAELERQLGRKLRSSSQPPSTDGPAVSPSRAERRRSARRPGKQPGAGGSALFPISNPNKVVDHLPDACGGCGSDLAGARPAGVVCRQVHDIPAVLSREVVEHRLHRRRCCSNAYGCPDHPLSPTPPRPGHPSGPPPSDSSEPPQPMSATRQGRHRPGPQTIHQPHHGKGNRC